MKKHFYAHVLYDNPGVYDYEYIIDSSDFQKFSTEIQSILEQQYEEVRFREEINTIDISGWEDFIESNKIEYNDYGWFPHEVIWNFLRAELVNTINGNEKNEEKYKVLDYIVSEFLRLIQDAEIDDGNGGEYIFDINIFNDSGNFAKHFFSYLSDSERLECEAGILKERVKSIIWLIENHDFPNSDLHEGMLQEWVNIYKLVFAD